MTPKDGLEIADHAFQQVSGPGGVLWVLIVVIICLFLVLLILGRWMFSQVIAFSDYLKTSNRELVAVVAQNTSALEGCKEESRCTREFMRRVEDELKRRPV